MKIIESQVEKRCCFCGIVLSLDYIKDWCEGCKEDLELDMPTGSWRKRLYLEHQDMRIRN